MVGFFLLFPPPLKKGAGQGYAGQSLQYTVDQFSRAKKERDEGQWGKQSCHFKINPRRRGSGAAGTAGCCCKQCLCKELHLQSHKPCSCPGALHMDRAGKVVLLPRGSSPRHTSKAAQHSRILSPRDEDSEYSYAVLSSKSPFWLTELPFRVSKDASPRLL